MRDPVTAGVTVGLEDQQADLARVQLDDFRAANLFRLVGSRLQAGDVLDVGCGAGGMVAWLLHHDYDARGIDVSETIISSAQDFLRQRGLDPTRVSATTIERLVNEGTTAANVVSMDCL